jgi:transposase
MRTTFSSEEIAELKKNTCVFDCTAKSVYYTVEFKKRALGLWAQGVHAREIWRRSGFDVSMWKEDYCRGTLHDWREASLKYGEDGLKQRGGIPYDRGPNGTEKDKLKRLELQVKYLEAENDFLAKLRAKRAESNSGRTKNTESF